MFKSKQFNKLGISINMIVFISSLLVVKGNAYSIFSLQKYFENIHR